MTIAILHSTARVPENTWAEEHRANCAAVNGFIAGSVQSGRIWEGGAHEVLLDYISLEDVEILRSKLVEYRRTTIKHNPAINLDFFEALMRHIEFRMEAFDGPNGAERLAEIQLAYARELKRPIAEKTPLPLDVRVPECASVQAQFFTTHHVPAFAARLGLEENVITHDDFETEGGLWLVQLSVPWEDRETFLNMLRHEKGRIAGADEFFRYVDEARNTFIDAVELPESEAA